MQDAARLRPPRRALLFRRGRSVCPAAREAVGVARAV